MNMREEFEKWVLSDYNLCGSDRAFLDKDISGEYVWPAIRIAWKIWQAAQPKWIEREGYDPVDSKWYVVSTEYGYYTQCWSDGDGWLGDDVSIPDDDVCYLMPLPNHAEE